VKNLDKEEDHLELKDDVKDVIEDPPADKTQDFREIAGSAM
jgi:hypothetical protein